MKIKICGIRSEKDVFLMNKYLPNYIGFIFFKKSPRYISSEKALSLKKLINPKIKTVGVFVDEDIKNVIDYFNQGIIDIVQLHGNEDEKYISKLKEKKIPVIKAVKVAKETDIKNTDKFSPDAYLFDVKNEVLVGGTGQSFNWDYLNNFTEEKPYFLAGGINSSNIQNALKTRASVLDISSGIETDYRKDPDKVKELFELIEKYNV